MRGAGTGKFSQVALFVKAGLRKPQVQASPAGRRHAMTGITGRRDAEHMKDVAAISDSSRIKTATAMGRATRFWKWIGLGRWS